jgi:hypothetical protein
VTDGELENGRYESARKYLSMLPSAEKRKKTFRMYAMILAFLESGEPTLAGAYFRSIQPGGNRHDRETSQ